MTDTLTMNHRQALGDPSNADGLERSIRMRLLYHKAKGLENEHAQKELEMIAEHTAKEKTLTETLHGIEDKHEAVIEASDTLQAARQTNTASKAGGDPTIISESEIALDVAKAAYDLSVQEFDHAEKAFLETLNDEANASQPNVYQDPQIG